MDKLTSNQTFGLVSVIIPAYNCEATISFTLASVWAQTYQNLEVIVVDNGSIDTTAQIVRSFTNRDDRVKYVYTDEKGAANARNLGFAHSCGEYVAYLDADDVWFLNKLQCQVDSLQRNPKAVLTYCGAEFVDQDLTHLYNSIPDKSLKGNVLGSLLQRNFIVCGSLPLVRREAIEEAGDWDSSLPASHDWDYWLRLAKLGEFEMIPLPLVKYRIAENSISSNIGRRLDCNFKVLDRAYASVGTEYQKYKQSSIANVWLHGAKMHLQRGNNKKEVRSNLVKALKVNPKLFFDKEYFKLVVKSFIK